MHRVVALIPAHNEEDLIERTVLSLVHQSYPLDVLIVSDNSTDQTMQIVRYLQSKYTQLSLIETKDNHFKKAGALNQAIAYLSRDYDYVLCADADTVLDKNLVQAAVEELDNDEALAAVCSRAGIQGPPKDKSWLVQLLWHLQHIEYGIFDSSRVETLGHIKVVHGMAAVYRLSSMREVMRYREKMWGVKNQVYDEMNIVEDYELTICLKELGCRVTASMNMLAWTEVPLTITGLWRQRVRWFRGGIDVLRKHGLNEVTWSEYLQHFLFLLMTVSQVIILTYLVYESIIGNGLTWSALTYLVLGAMYIDGIYRLRYVQNLAAVDIALKLVFIVDMLYAWFYLSQQIFSYYLSFANKDQGW